jgi:hypothetical protein
MRSKFSGVIVILKVQLSAVIRQSYYRRHAKAILEVRAIKKTLALEHPLAATTICELVRVCRETGRCAEAETLFQRVRAIASPKGDSSLISGRSQTDCKGPFVADPGPT